MSGKHTDQLQEKQRINPDSVARGEARQKQRLAELKDIKRRAGTSEETEEEKYYREKEEKLPKHYECKACGERMSGEMVFHAGKFGCPNCGQVKRGYNYFHDGFDEKTEDDF